MPKKVLGDIDRFLATDTAKRLKLRSRADVLTKLAIGLLERHDKMYEQLEKLFDASDEEIKELNKREEIKRWQLD